MSSLRIFGIVGLMAGILLAACAAPASNPAASAPPTGEQAPAARTMVVYKSPTCGCCSDWVGYMEQHGYTATVEMVEDIAVVKEEHNIPTAVWSCHTALLDGYIIEGHVPVEAIERLLTERPPVAGIAVPGMPVGSPGMEMAGAAPQPFDVVTFDASGATAVYSSYHQ